MGCMKGSIGQYDGMDAFYMMNAEKNTSKSKCVSVQHLIADHWVNIFARLVCESTINISLIRLDLYFLYLFATCVIWLKYLYTALCPSVIDIYSLRSDTYLLRSDTYLLRCDTYLLRLTLAKIWHLLPERWYWLTERWHLLVKKWHLLAERCPHA